MTYAEFRDLVAHMRQIQLEIRIDYEWIAKNRSGLFDHTLIRISQDLERQVDLALRSFTEEPTL